MRNKIKQQSCIACGKSKLAKDEIGINMKLLGEMTENFYCLDCLADYLGCNTQNIIDKIEEFKEDGCRLFS